MAGIIKAIFDSKNNLGDIYPDLPNVKNFDIERKHLLYGRIDRSGDAVELDNQYIRQIPGIKTEFAAAFVCDAFNALKGKIRQAYHGNALTQDSYYALNLKAHKAWRAGDLGYNYNRYLNNLYTDFVGNYLEVDRRYEKITNFKDFTKEFLRYVLRIIHHFPLTKTGFVLSNHCSPFISGLMVEIAHERHGVANNLNVFKYINDPGFKLFVTEANKFGFMVDKNAPWRLVFNISSGAYNKEVGDVLLGAQKYMDQYGAGHSNVFKIFYNKTHIKDLQNLKNKMYSLYDSFYTQYSTYEQLEYVGDPDGACVPLKTPRRTTVGTLSQANVIKRRKEREIPGVKQFDTTEESDEYWLKILLKLRMSETDFPHTVQNFDFYIKEMTNLYRMFNTKAALNYINNLTKGFQVTKFNRRGEFWYGTERPVYEERKKQALKKAYDPDRVQYSLTGTGNITK